MPVDHPDDEGMRVSHETIYECLYLRARSTLRTDLKLALRRRPTSPPTSQLLN